MSKCENCKQSIVQINEGVTAFGKAYHRKHLKCAVTGKDFTDGSDAFEGEARTVHACTSRESERGVVVAVC